nr:MAG TPA: hypothetical protein [Caudoviricetes sp.]
MIISKNKNSESTWLRLFLNFQKFPGSDFYPQFALFTYPIMKRILIIGGHHYVTRTKICS